MKKITKKIIALGINLLLASSLGISAYAVTTGELLPSPATTNAPVTGGYEQIQAIKNLPDVTVEGIVGTFIKTVLGWTFIISLVAIVVAGIYLLVFEGEEEKVTQAKNIIKYLVIGMLLVGASYGIVSGLVRINFF